MRQITERLLSGWASLPLVSRLTLAKHRKGDLVSVAGNMQLNQWTGQDGGTQQGYQVIADSVLSARTVRPGGKAGQQGQATDALRRAHEQQPPATGYEGYDQTPPYDDDS
jgi:single-stranded DNA-binding protein